MRDRAPVDSPRDIDEAATPPELETFVVIHDQELLLECERQGRFASLDGFRYVFVGSKPTDLVEERDDVVVARRLADNIEDFPDLLSFTGWYAVARNRLTTSEYVALLEYDVELTKGFSTLTVDALRDHSAIAGYVPLRLTHPLFLHATPWLVESMEDVHGLDVPAIVRTHLERDGDDEWMTTTNRAMRTKDLVEFVDWFLPVTLRFRKDPDGSHVHERAVSVYCLIRGLEDRCVPGVLRHVQRMSHGVEGRTPGEALTLAAESDPLIPVAKLYPRLLAAELALDERSARVAQLELAVGEREARLVELEQALGSHTRRESALEHRAFVIRRRYEDLLDSRSWRLMAPFRAIGRHLRASHDRRAR